MALIWEKGPEFRLLNAHGAQEDTHDGQSDGDGNGLVKKGGGLGSGPAASALVAVGNDEEMDSSTMPVAGLNGLEPHGTRLLDPVSIRGSSNQGNEKNGRDDEVAPTEPTSNPTLTGTSPGSVSVADFITENGAAISGDGASKKGRKPRKDKGVRRGPRKAKPALDTSTISAAHEQASAADPAPNPVEVSASTVARKPGGRKKKAASPASIVKAPSPMPSVGPSEPSLPLGGVVSGRLSGQGTTPGIDVAEPFTAETVPNDIPVDSSATAPPTDNPEQTKKRKGRPKKNPQQTLGVEDILDIRPPVEDELSKCNQTWKVAASSLPAKPTSASIHGLDKKGKGKERPPLKPRVWTSSKTELQAAVPAFTKDTNGVCWTHCETVVVILDDDAGDPRKSTIPSRSIEMIPVPDGGDAVFDLIFTRALVPVAASAKKNLAPMVSVEKGDGDVPTADPSMPITVPTQPDPLPVETSQGTPAPGEKQQDRDAPILEEPLSLDYPPDPDSPTHPRIATDLLDPVLSTRAAEAAQRQAQSSERLQKAFEDFERTVEESADAFIARLAPVFDTDAALAGGVKEDGSLQPPVCSSRTAGDTRPAILATIDSQKSIIEPSTESAPPTLLPATASALTPDVNFSVSALHLSKGDPSPADPSTISVKTASKRRKPLAQQMMENTTLRRSGRATGNRYRTAKQAWTQESTGPRRSGRATANPYRSEHQSAPVVVRVKRVERSTKRTIQSASASARQLRSRWKQPVGKDSHTSISAPMLRKRKRPKLPPLDIHAALDATFTLDLDLLSPLSAIASDDDSEGKVVAKAEERQKRLGKRKQRPVTAPTRVSKRLRVMRGEMDEQDAMAIDFVEVKEEVKVTVKVKRPRTVKKARGDDMHKEDKPAELPMDHAPTTADDTAPIAQALKNEPSPVHEMVPFEQTVAAPEELAPLPTILSKTTPPVAVAEIDRSVAQACISTPPAGQVSTPAEDTTVIPQIPKNELSPAHQVGPTQPPGEVAPPVTIPSATTPPVAAADVDIIVPRPFISAPPVLSETSTLEVTTIMEKAQKPSLSLPSLPMEVRTIIDAFIQDSPVSIIASRERTRELLPDGSKTLLDTEFGYAYLGLFKVLGLEEKLVVRSGGGRDLADPLTVEWRFRVQWNVGGETIVKHEEDVSRPWWKDSSISSLKLQSSTMMDVRGERNGPSLSTATTAVESSSSGGSTRRPSEETMDTSLPPHPRPPRILNDVTTPPLYMQAKMEHPNWHLRDIPHWDMYFSLVPSSMLAGLDSCIPDDAFPTGWFCSECGMVNFQRAMRHRRCGSKACSERPPEGYFRELADIRGPHGMVPVPSPYNEFPKETVTSLSTKWKNGMQTFSYYLDGDQKKVFVKHVFTANVAKFQKPATNLLFEIQKNVELVRVAGDSGNPYFVRNYDLPIEQALGPSDASNSTPDRGSSATNPECIVQARNVMVSRSRNYAEVSGDVMKINRLEIVGWVAAGSRRNHPTLRAKASPVAVLCLGCDVVMTVRPAADRAVASARVPRVAKPKKPKGEGKPQAGQEPQESSAQPLQPDLDQLMPMDETPAEPGLEPPATGSPDEQVSPPLPLEPVSAPAQASSTAPVPRDIKLTMVHGDIVVFYGSDFDYSLKRAGPSILVFGSS
ncbi:hypothetical protein CC2G_012249 [Coprinopsis cinerea AmutBmut pab1-1]|nr:hypothetical protein CC2G_012249 [Coprinopsis cinerea AmutBmut pab1-1]